MIFIIDFLRAAVFIYLSIVIFNGVKNDNPINRVKVTQAIFKCTLVSLILCIVALVWILVSFDTAVNWKQENFSTLPKD